MSDSARLTDALSAASNAAGFYCEHNALHYRDPDFREHDYNNPCPEEVEDMAFVIVDDNGNPIAGDPSGDLTDDRTGEQDDEQDNRQDDE